MVNSILNINKAGQNIDFSWLPRLESLLRRRFKQKIKNRSISLALVSSKEIRRCNRIYRQKDEVTDVLSFSLQTKEILGEVLICLVQARKQAKDKHQTLQSELKLLVVHGILHLLGYDHEVSKQAANRQHRAEDDILRLIG